LCSSCLSGLYGLREPITRNAGDYHIRSLFSWRRNGPRALSWLLRSLKQEDQVLPWREIAVWLVSSFALPSEDCLLVPIPSQRGRPNHALGLARALSDMLGFPVREALAQGGGGEQKRRRGYERSSIEFERAIWNFHKENHKILIVDDVVTTGSTVRGAYLALGHPQRCEVWCLMDRRPCDNAMPLI
jgi:predicted amidophosphoribosyltransferase